MPDDRLTELIHDRAAVLGKLASRISTAAPKPDRTAAEVALAMELNRVAVVLEQFASAVYE